MKYVFVLDFDGVLTDGKMYYTKEGKYMKAFGSDDFDLLRYLAKHIDVHVITADRKGYPITARRMKEVGLKLSVVEHGAERRWSWIKEQYPDHVIFFMGDSLSDYLSLKNSDIGITVKDALGFTKRNANVIIDRSGANRAVAQAILYLNDKYEFFNLEECLGG